MDRFLKNHIIADMFNLMAKILEFQGESIFKVNAYRNAGRNLINLQVNIEDLWRNDKIHTIPGIGQALTKKIEAYLNTGHISQYDKLIQSIPQGIIDLLNINYLGPKTVITIQNKLDVQNVEDLIKVVQNGKLSNLPGMGPKKIQQIELSIKEFKTRTDSDTESDSSGK